MRLPPRVHYLTVEAWQDLTRNALTTVALVLSVAVSLTLFGAALLVDAQVDRAAAYWYDKIEVSVFLCDGRNCPAITDRQRERLRSDLEADPHVAEAFYESKQEAYERFREMFRNQPDFVESVGPDVLPASFRVKLVDRERFGVVADRYGAYPGIDDVVDQREVLSSFFALTGAIRLATLVIAGVQMAAACVLISNTTRMRAHARREQTRIMKLVGASNWYVRLPFVTESVVAATVGAALAWGVLLAAVPAASARLGQSIRFLPFIGVEATVAVGPWLLLVGVATAAVSSLASLRSHIHT